MILSGWGRYPAIQCNTRDIQDPNSVLKVFEETTSLIARGNGRAYGDAALNSEMTVLMAQCNRVIFFDEAHGVIECEAGLLLADLLDLVVPCGWFPYVVPGTKYVTIGGLIAADVHGKNHHVDSSFGRYVESLRLALPNATIINCSFDENSEIFLATLGGMGLTGVILSARFKLRKISTPFIEQSVIRAPTLDATLDLIESNPSAMYSVAWIDCLARGRHMGRGLLMLGEHFEAEQRSGVLDDLKRLGRSKGFAVPIDLPFSLLNSTNIRLFNELYFRFPRSEHRILSYDRFFFPLDRVRNWNRIYGRRGFVQYQCAVAGSDTKTIIKRMLDCIVDCGSFLSVIKKLGAGNRFLSFPMKGYTVSFDFPANSATMSSLARLDAILVEHSGRIYLAKDARTPRVIVERGYPEINAFRNLRQKIDPKRKLRSALSERLGL